MKLLSGDAGFLHAPLGALLFVVGTGYLFPPSAAAQSQAPVLRVETDLQTVNVQVKDAQGNDVKGLSARDFTVRENGRPRKIAFLNTLNDPVSIVVLVDSSSTVSASSQIGSAQEIAARFLRAARPGDDISAMNFTSQMGPFQQMTDQQLLHPSGIALAPAPRGGSALYDAIAAALCHLRSSKNLRQAVIVVTDGVDQHSRLSLEQLTDWVRSSRAQVFMIGLRVRPEFYLSGHAEPKLTLESGHDIDNPTVVFDRLMKESGAESFIPHSAADLHDALQAVSDMLESEYTLAYYPPKATAKLRKIDVKVERHGVRVLARQLVGASPGAAGLVHFDEGTCTVSATFHPYPYESKLARDATEMVYREDFSDAHSGWPIHADSHYLSGGYELSNPKAPDEVAETIPRALEATQLSYRPPTEASAPTAFRQNIIAAYGPWWWNFRASATMRAELAAISRGRRAYGGRPAAGLVFRMNLNGYYAVLISRAADKKKLSVELVRMDRKGNSYVETALIPWSTMDEPSTSANDLAVAAKGSRLSIFVDGQKVETVKDDRFDQGLVGFIMSGPGQATFRKLVVEGR